MVKRGSRTIVFDVSRHGFGHLGQIAPVVTGMIAQHPTTRVVVRSTHAASLVKNNLGCHVDLDEPPPEASLVMLDPTTVDIAASEYLRLRTLLLSEAAAALGVVRSGHSPYLHHAKPGVEVNVHV
jgi:hypothetical protein